MGKNIHVSVVIPAFNEEAYIEPTLKALQNQNYPKENYEIVVVDNNSTDNTASIAVKFGAKVVREEKQGYVFTFNKGVFSAANEVIAVTDADTKVSDDWVKKIAQAFEDEKLVALTGEIRPETSSKFRTKFLAFLYNLFLSFNFSIGKPHLTGPNLAFRKSFFKQIGGLDIRFEMSPDVDLGLRLKKYGKVILRKDIWVLTSTRRWEKGRIKAFWKYGVGYFNTVWFRKPPKVELEVYR